MLAEVAAGMAKACRKSQQNRRHAFGEVAGRQWLRAKRKGNFNARMHRITGIDDLNIWGQMLTFWMQTG